MCVRAEPQVPGHFIWRVGHRCCSKTTQKFLAVTFSMTSVNSRKLHLWVHLARAATHGKRSEVPEQLATEWDAFSGVKSDMASSLPLQLDWNSRRPTALLHIPFTRPSFQRQKQRDFYVWCPSRNSHLKVIPDLLTPRDCGGGEHVANDGG